MEEYQYLYQKSIDEPEQFWSNLAKREIHWLHDFHDVNDIDFDDGMVSWFLSGRLNVCENCVDRHVKTHGDQTAIIWEANDSQDSKKITYKELQKEICWLANVLRHYGVRKWDKVAIYMPMIPEAAYAMLVCARIGAVHSVIFAGFSAEALRDRINDAKCKVVITADEGVRGKKTIPLKRTVDEATMACPTVEHVFIAKRTGNKVPFFPPRDIWLDEAMEQERPYSPIEHMDSEW